jgi:hypothetical protein
MKKNNSSNRVLVKLALISLALMSVAIALYSQEEVSKWQEELAKALMGLAITAVAGGFIKFLFDRYQETEEDKRKKREEAEEDKRKAKEIESERKEKQKQFREELLNHLRKTFDEVDGARLLIEAHKSAKTYSEKMKENIIPVIVSLYDIKRSLVDSVDMIDEINLKSLRINIHYMIAYLQALADEYRDNYPAISNWQYYEEEWKKKTRDHFIKHMQEEHPANSISPMEIIKEKIPRAPEWAWSKIIQLPLMGRFLQDDYDSPYRKMFVDFYEWNKKILKDQKIKKKPEWYDEKYITVLKEIDKKKEEGILTKDDSLVNRLIKDKLISRPFMKQEILKNKPFSNVTHSASR